jgi:hypothetical protein
MATDLNNAKLELTKLQQQYNTAKANQAPKGNTSAAQVKAALNALKAKQTEVKNLEAAGIQAATDAANKAKTEKEAADIKSGKVVVTQAMQQAGIDKDILKEMQALGLPFSPEAFSASGVGSTILVYLGTKKGIVSPSNAKKIQFGQKADVATTNSVYKQFWDDPATKSKVKSAMVSAGITNVNDISAYEQWKQIVNTSAELYAAGKGPKMTPMDVLNQVVGASGAPNLPDRSITKIDPEITKAIANAAFQSAYMRDGTEEEITNILKAAGVDKMIAQGTLTTTKKVKNPKTGQLENVTTTTPGFNAQTAQLSIEDKLKELNPDEFDRTKRIDFASWLSKNVMGA